MKQRDSSDTNGGRAPQTPDAQSPAPDKGGPNGGAPELAPAEDSTPDAEGEAYIWIGRTHWKHFSGMLAVWILGNLVVTGVVIWAAPRLEWLTFSRGFTLVVLVLAVSGLEFVGRRVLLRILDHRYRLTNERLFIERGLLSQTVDQTELIRVDDVRIHKSQFDRIFGIGTVAVMSTDATDREITIEGIAQPDEVAEAIRKEMRALRRKSLFIEHL